ncbi:MAG TPA: Type 1 glutamine amidotransferase-like domain-containing protein [Chloroflexota bacterium]|nr:Type 1 glutamine amidotransferase-like domain-containing protein [Chloroflexota bacterium]
MTSKEVGHGGPIALVGSGEFLPVMDETDLALLEQLGGPASTRVVILPTASGLEDLESPARWARMGVEHFGRLGARVDAAPILTRDDALDPRWLPLLEAANFFYFSGGNPLHLIGSMRDTPTWATIRRRHAEGAVLAGCSAGAMAMCGRTSRLRALREDGPPEWIPALGLLPRLIVLPHYDRMAGFVGQDVVDRVIKNLPEDTVLLGIEEDTALTRMNGAAWRVSGVRNVWVFTSHGGKAHGAGDVVVA